MSGLVSADEGKNRMSFVEKLKFAFAIGYEPPRLTDDDKTAIMALAEIICRRRLEVPAIMALESLRPMNFLASQVMVMLQPFVGMLADESFFVSCQAAFEKRESVGFLIEHLEDRLNERKLDEKKGLRAISPESDEASEGQRGVDG